LVAHWVANFAQLEKWDLKEIEVLEANLYQDIKILERLIRTRSRKAIFLKLKELKNNDNKSKQRKKVFYKLDEGKVKDIRVRLENQESARDIAILYSVDRSLIYMIKNNKIHC
jgi:hypothetical protein